MALQKIHSKSCFKNQVEKNRFLNNSFQKSCFKNACFGPVLKIQLEKKSISSPNSSPTFDVSETFQGCRKFWVGRIFYYARNFYVRTSKNSTCIHFEKEVSSKSGLFFGKVKTTNLM